MLVNLKKDFMLKMFITLLFAGIMLFIAVFARADSRQEPMLLSPDEAVELALRNNLDLEASRIGADNARRTSNLWWNQLIPSVDASGTMSHLNRAPPNGGSQWGLSGSISAVIDINFAMFRDINRLRLDYERGLLSYTNAKIQLERDTRKAYHNILLLQENAALLRVSMENTERQAQIAETNYNAGVISEITLLQAQVSREALRPVIDQAEAYLRLSMMHFSMILGLPHDTIFELKPVNTEMSLVLPDTANLISRAAAGQPDVQELRQEILIMNSIRRSSNLWLFTPTLSLGWNADPTFNMDPWNDSWFHRNRWDQYYGAFNITLSFRLNGLLPFGTERQSVRTLEDQIRIANISLSQMIRMTEIEIHDLVLSLERMQSSMVSMEQTLALAERSFRLSEEAYRLGRLDYTQVQNAELSLRQVRLQLYEQQFNYLNSLLDLEYALGVPFGSLTSIKW